MAGKIRQLKANQLATSFEDAADNLKTKVIDIVTTIESPLDLYLDSIKDLGDDPDIVDPVQLTNLDSEDVTDIQARINDLLAAVKVKTDLLDAPEQALLKSVLGAIAANIP